MTAGSLDVSRPASDLRQPVRGDAPTTPESRVPETRARTRTRKRFPIGWILPVAIVLVWFAAYQFQWINPVLFSSPVEVAKAFWSAVLDGSFVTNLSASVGRWLLGFALGGALGLAAGALTGLSTASERQIGRAPCRARV